MMTTPRQIRPEMMNWSCHGWRWSSVWVATRLAHSAPMVGPSAQNPIATPATHLRRKVAHQCGGRDQNDPLDEADDAVGRGEPPLVVDVRDGQQLDERDDQGPVDGEIGPPDLVRQPPDEHAEGTDRVGNDQEVQEELERHVVVGQQQRRDRALHVVEVIQHDRREHDDGQVPEPRPRVGVLVELPLPQGVRQPPLRNRCAHRCRGHLRTSGAKVDIFSATVSRGLG